MILSPASIEQNGASPFTSCFIIHNVATFFSSLITLRKPLYDCCWTEQQEFPCEGTSQRGYNNVSTTAHQQGNIGRQSTFSKLV